MVTADLLRCVAQEGDVKLQGADEGVETEDCAGSQWWKRQVLFLKQDRNPQGVG